MGPSESREWANAVRDGITEYRAANCMSETEVKECIALAESLLGHAEQMNGKLALALSDWVSVLTMVLEDKERIDR